MIFNKADILLPDIEDYRKWAVIACDQFTSQPDYWKEIQESVKDSLSTLHLILPEAELSENDDARIADINATMEQYLKDRVFNCYKDSYIYVERQLENGVIRKGIIGAIDLEDYDYNPDAASGIRATEKTVIERIPPRVRIRENARLELPHILLLCDDPRQKLIDSVRDLKSSLPVLYDFDLMQNGGHITGWLVTGAHAAIFDKALEQYLKETKEKYRELKEAPMYFAVGDGNHSLATAKECYEHQKAKSGSGIKARYALVELENLQDESQQFEPIHRLVKQVSTEQMLKEIKEIICVTKSRHKIEYYTKNEYGTLYLDERLGELPVGILQNFLDDYAERHSCTMDYIHDDEVLKALSQEPDTIGFLLSAIEKDNLFQGIIKDGVLPRKTFSMGHALEKRYYIEAREIM